MYMNREIVHWLGNVKLSNWKGIEKKSVHLAQNYKSGKNDSKVKNIWQVSSAKYKSFLVKTRSICVNSDLLTNGL